MELLQLKYFQVVAMNQHITRSAEQLHVSQPAVSTVISRLEQELGVPLFEHVGRNVVLNEYGKVFFERVNRILMEVDNAKQEIQDLCGDRDHVISLSVTSPQFLQGIKPFMVENPHIKWRQNVKTLPEIVGMLENGQIDISITSPGIWKSGIESVILYKDEFMVAVHPDHPLSKKKSVSLAEISGEKFIMLQKGLPFRTQIDQLFADQGIEPNIVMECDHYLRKELLNANAGITLTSRSALYRHLYDEKICFLPIDDIDRGRDIVMSWKSGKYLTNATREFCEFLQKYYQSFSNNNKAEYKADINI